QVARALRECASRFKSPRRDALNRATKETDPLGHNSALAYDAAVRMPSSTDRLGESINLSYDAASERVVAGWKNSITTFATRLLPRSWNATIFGWVISEMLKRV